MMVGLLEKEVGVPPRQSKTLRRAHRRADPRGDGHRLSQHRRGRRRGEDPSRDRQGLSPNSKPVVLLIGQRPNMMDRKKTLAAIARHVTDADIVLPVYSTAFDWIDIRPNPLNYLSHGAMGLASSHGARPGARPPRQAGDRARRRRQPVDEPRHAGQRRGGRAEEPVPLRLRERHLRGQRRPSDPGPRRGQLCGHGALGRLQERL